MQKRQLLKLLSLSLILTACGTTGSSSSDNDTSEEKVGYLIDSAVGGIEYRCGTKIGITGTDGIFSCPTLPVSFFVGSTNLGSIDKIPNDNKVFPQDIIGVDREKMENDEVIKLATLLQSLDSDGDASNGITVTSETRKSFEGEVETLLEDIELDELKDLHPDLELKDQETVIAHLSFSLNALGEDEEATEVKEDDKEPDNSSNQITTTGEELPTPSISTDERDEPHNDNSNNDTPKNSATLPASYTHRAINNQGISVEGSLQTYTIRIYSDSKERANAQSLHQGVVVRFNGKTSENIAIQSSYVNKKIVIAIYDATGHLVKVSDEILVTDDVPIIIVEMGS